MTVVLCADDRGGLSFHGRRQSRDRLVYEDLLSQAAGRLLWMEPCSRPLFPQTSGTVRTAEEPSSYAIVPTPCVFYHCMGQGGRTSWWSTGGTGTTPPTGSSFCPRRAGR